MYNSRMTRDQLTLELSRLAEKQWGDFCELYPSLVRYNPPEIKLCGRIWRTGGYCNFLANKVTLGYKFFAKYNNYMRCVILPHELAHQIDYNLNGEMKPKDFHGPKWQKIMNDYGLPADQYHTMEIVR